MTSSIIYAGTVVHVARQYLGTPYYGQGTDKDGIDGTNLVCLAFQLAGFSYEGQPDIVSIVQGDKNRLQTFLDCFFCPLPVILDHQRHLPLKHGDVAAYRFSEEVPAEFGLVSKSNYDGKFSLIVVTEYGVEELEYPSYMDGNYPKFILRAYRMKGIQLFPDPTFP